MDLPHWHSSVAKLSSESAQEHYCFLVQLRIRAIASMKQVMQLALAEGAAWNWRFRVPFIPSLLLPPPRLLRMELQWSTSFVLKSNGKWIIHFFSLLLPCTGLWLLYCKTSCLFKGTVFSHTKLHMRQSWAADPVGLPMLPIHCNEMCTGELPPGLCLFQIFLCMLWLGWQIDNMIQESSMVFLTLWVLLLGTNGGSCNQQSVWSGQCFSPRSCQWGKIDLLCQTSSSVHSTVVGGL